MLDLDRARYRAVGTAVFLIRIPVHARILPKRVGGNLSRFPGFYSISLTTLLSNKGLVSNVIWYYAFLPAVVGIIFAFGLECLSPGHGRFLVKRG